MAHILHTRSELCVCVYVLGSLHFKIFIWQERRIKERNYMTAYNIMTSTDRGFIYRGSNLAGPEYRKIMYVIVQAVATLTISSIGYMCFHS